MSSEWELLKENVEPLKSGRSMKTLKNALTQNASDLNAREERRKEFESELRTYEGSDLLSVYYDYIQWIEQNYPLGGNEANLKTLLEKCIEQFYELDEYRNDKRLLSIFLKFIKRVDSPLEMFQFFHENGFAEQLSDFYINWSFHLENTKNCRKAADVLRLGIARNAEPMGPLTAALEQLEFRVAKAIVNHKTDDLNENASDDEPKRQPLNKLKTKTAKKGRTDAPVSRVGNAVKKTGDGLKASTGASNSGQMTSNKTPAIYCDENDPTLPEKVSTGTVKTSRSAKHVSSVGNVGQENERKAGKWSENQLKLKSIAKSEPKFTIHADEDSEDECPERVKKPPQSNALKVRPRGADSPPIARFEKADPLKKFYFNEHKLFAGGEEFCFEEIRGRQWMLKRKHEEEDNRKAKLEEEVEELKQQIQLLLHSQQNAQQLSDNSSEMGSNIDSQNM
ncbi:unnamed protein product [Oppiella nova]|uniref:BUB1 N-terminal domain-containing protein n=1 Tax=Oppiella nova TaxID=334625 RepID=A0A7R9QAJ6_9ACAR|nr:unnamed protein product [Oppiella nova]CAG2161763.1 unnamed protein product [Oppiella nova]